MIVYERQMELLRYLRKEHFATIKDLAVQVFASESSVRRDIKALESKGYVKQIYGGVVLAEYENQVVPLNLRDGRHAAEKEAVAQMAAQKLFDGATVLMDGSSTVRRILKYMDKSYRLTIFTNNLRLLSENQNDRLTIYLTGGLYVQKSGILIGARAEEYVRSIHADLLFFSSQGLSDEGIISDNSEQETHLRKVMLSRADRKYFLCDDSKLHKKNTFSLCHMDEIDGVFCNVHKVKSPSVL